MAETSYDLATIADLVHLRLAPQHVQRIQMAPKDPDRFDKFVAVRQEMCRHADPVLLPLTENLDIVNSEGRPVVRCQCGQDFGDYRENWKLRALVLVRDSGELLSEVLGADHGYNPELVEFREYICPGCGALLDLETLPPAAPVLFDVLPDLATFYRDWLGRELPITDDAFEDRSQHVLDDWASGSLPQS
jgi:acetone carboxylase, gamma subunit